MSQNDICMIGKLAMIELHEDEQDELEKGIKQMLQYMQQMSEVDLSSLEPTVCVTGKPMIPRSDAVHSDNEVCELMLQQAPETQGRYITIPKVLS